MMVSVVRAILESSSPPKYPLDDYRPAVAHPQTSQDWIENVKGLRDWLSSVFTNILALDSDVTKRSTLASGCSADWQQYSTNRSLEETRVCSASQIVIICEGLWLAGALTLFRASLCSAETRFRYSRRARTHAAGVRLVSFAIAANRDALAHHTRRSFKVKGTAILPS